MAITVVVGAQFGAGFKHRIQQRNLRGGAFSGIALGAEVSGLQDLLEEIRLKKALGQQRGPPAGAAGIFHAVLYPFAAVALRQVHEFRADGAAINLPGLLRCLSIGGQFGIAARDRPAKGIEAGVQVSPAAERVKRLVALQGNFGLIVRS